MGLENANTDSVNSWRRRVTMPLQVIPMQILSSHLPYFPNRKSRKGSLGSPGDGSKFMKFLLIQKEQIFLQELWEKIPFL